MTPTEHFQNLLDAGVRKEWIEMLDETRPVGMGESLNLTDNDPRVPMVHAEVPVAPGVQTSQDDEPIETRVGGAGTNPVYGHAPRVRLHGMETERRAAAGRFSALGVEMPAGAPDRVKTLYDAYVALGRLLFGPAGLMTQADFWPQNHPVPAALQERMNEVPGGAGWKQLSDEVAQYRHPSRKEPFSPEQYAQAIQEFQQARQGASGVAESCAQVLGLEPDSFKEQVRDSIQTTRPLPSRPLHGNLNPDIIGKLLPGTVIAGYPEELTRTPIDRPFSADSDLNTVRPKPAPPAVFAWGKRPEGVEYCEECRLTVSSGMSNGERFLCQWCHKQSKGSL
jgi:hypothetical protein